MSYDISIVSADGTHMEAAEPHTIAGGTYALGGTDELWLNITYNYSPFFHRHLDKEQGVRWLYGKLVKETLQRLQSAIESCDTEAESFVYEPAQTLAAGIGSKMIDLPASDYWAPTPQNAAKALRNLLRLAQHGLEGVWSGD